MKRPTRREAIQTGLAGLGFAATTSASPYAINRRIHSFHYDHVIGTSLDVSLESDDPHDSHVVERVVLEEIERLRRVFSTFDLSSELSWLNRARGAVTVSTEMLEVLRAYDLWQSRSHGALNGRLEELIQLWRHAEESGVEPNPSDLIRVVERIAEPAWSIDEAGSVTRTGDQQLNLNSIAKGFIIDRAFGLALAKAPSLTRLLINLGGDLRVYNGSCWRIGVQNPSEPEDNAPPLITLRADNAAIATSGGYLRTCMVNGRRGSHLLDPRTGRSADGVASATVIARDNITANALATALCVLAPAEGLRLVAETPQAECLIVSALGVQFRSACVAEFEAPIRKVESVCLAAANNVAAWPDGFQMSISIELPKIASPKYRKPYVAVWIEDSTGKAIRTIAVWGNSPKYLRDLSGWWKFAQGNNALIAVTRATRLPGKYTLTWDGKDDSGALVEQGVYVVKVEVHREHGKHLVQSGKIRCESAAAKVTLEKNAETEATVVEFGKKK